MLKNVVLPAPFGPMIARSSPAATLQRDIIDRDQAAEMLASRCGLRSSVMLRPAVRSEAEQAAREEQHDEHEQQADERTSSSASPRRE